MSSPKRSSRWRTSASSRVFVSVTEKLQCGSPVQAIDGRANAVDVEREADLGERGDGLVDAAAGTFGDDRGSAAG